MGRQLTDQAFGQRLDDVVLLVLRFGLAADGDDRPHRLRVRCGAFGFAVAVGLTLDGRLVLGTDIAALDGQSARAVDADKGASARDLGRIVEGRPVLEGGDRRLDLLEPQIDRLRQVLAIVMLGVEPVQFLGQGLIGGLFVGGEFGAFARDPAQTGGVAVGEVQRGIDPAPALSREFLGSGADLRGGEGVEQRRILQPSAVVGLEQVAQRCAARCLIGLDPDELRTTIRGAHRALGQHAPDLIGLAAVGSLDGLPHLHLPGMVMRHREGHELVKCDAVLGIDVKQRRSDRGEPQSLTDHGRGDVEAGGDILLAHAAFHQGLEGFELIERMQRLAVDVLGEAVFLGGDRGASVADVAGDRRGLGQSLGLDQ